MTKIVPLKFLCPCCGYPELSCAPYAQMGLPPWFDHGQPPYHNQYGYASYECCSCCGYEFGFDDDPGACASACSFAEYLGNWVLDGCNWFAPAKRPDNWNLSEQLARAWIPLP
jgi:hypothetical protein